MRRIVCLGGGPAGLYAAILLRKALPSSRIEIYERNRPDDTFGWGVVFSDQTMGNFRAADPETHSAVLSSFHHWDDIAIHFGGRPADHVHVEFEQLEFRQPDEPGAV